jgi:hypothetical protein
MRKDGFSFSLPIFCAKKHACAISFTYNDISAERQVWKLPDYRIQNGNKGNVDFGQAGMTEVELNFFRYQSSVCPAKAE